MRFFSWLVILKCQKTDSSQFFIKFLLNCFKSPNNFIFWAFRERDRVQGPNLHLKVALRGLGDSEQWTNFNIHISVALRPIDTFHY